MDAIQEPNAKFQFSNLILTPPTNSSGGNHFIKFIFNANPIYIQTPKCKIKQGVSKSGKKMFIDLIFTNEHEEFMQWIENLENHSQTYIFSKREKWFESTLEEHDIENLFTTILKPIKLGKFYVLRVNIPTVTADFKIYDENETIMSSEDLKEDTNVICILEFQGIKCSARGFQFEIETKQILLLKPQNIFDKCILSKKRENSESVQLTEAQKDCNTDETEDEKYNKIGFLAEDEDGEDGEPQNTIFIDTTTSEVEDVTIEQTQEAERDEGATDADAPENVPEDVTTDVDVPVPIIRELPESDKKEELLEIDFNLEEVPKEDSITLKKRNDVYYEMYKEAIKKAKVAKDLALSSYLEAKRIKNLYMLDDLSEDEESDFEIEES
jgi:hypothetical protein